MIEIIHKSLDEHIELFNNLHLLKHDIAQLTKECLETLRAGNKILIAGNGGSAADAQHIAAELTGRFETTRKGLAAIALTTDSSAMTAISNDFGFESIYSRQIEAIANKGDLFIGISTSGNSANIIKSIEAAYEKGCLCWGLTGRSGGEMNKLLCEKNIVVSSERTARIQEAHIFIGHTVCELIDEAYKHES